MLDRVREAIFSTAAPWLEGARVLDLFAGSGSLGFEALSRGAKEVRFVEMDKRVTKVIEENAATLGVDRGLYQVRLGNALDRQHWFPEGTDLVFLDPPFPLVKDRQARARMMSWLGDLLNEGLAPEGLVVLHVPRDLLGEADLPECDSAERTYGGQSIWYLQAPDGD